MDIQKGDKPKYIKRQYVDSVQDYKLFYNPLGYGGVTVADIESQRLISLCDGINTIDEIIQIDGRSEQIVMQEIETLAKRELVSLSDEWTNDLHKQFISKPGMACWMHLTNECNLACSYCFIHKSPGNMSLETGILAIDKIIQSCNVHHKKNALLLFSGGEPLLQFELLKKLVDYSQSKKGEINFSYAIVTNAVLVTQEIANYLKENNVGIAVSLDGIKEVHDASRYDRNGKGSFDAVIKGLNTLRAAGNEPSVTTVVSNSNHESLIELTKFILDNNYRFRFSLERDCISGWPGSLDNLDNIISSLHKCYDYIEENLPLNDFNWIHTFGETVFSRPQDRCCSAGENFFAIGHDNSIGVCGAGLATPFSTLDNSSDLLDNVKMNNLDLGCNHTSKNKKCHSCFWEKSCAGGCPLQAKATYGTYDKPSPYCQLYTEILPRILRIKAMQLIRNINI